MTKQKAFTKEFEAIEHDIADLSRRHEKADPAAHGINHSMQLRVHAAFRAPDQPTRTRFFTPRLDAVRWGLRYVFNPMVLWCDSFVGMEGRGMGQVPQAETRLSPLCMFAKPSKIN